MKLACMPGCVSPEVRLPLDQRICVLIVVKNVLWPAQEVVFVLHRSKIPLVLTTKVTHLRSMLFKQQDGVNSVIRRTYYLEITAKLVPTSVINWYICICQISKLKFWDIIKVLDIQIFCLVYKQFFYIYLVKFFWRV